MIKKYTMILFCIFIEFVSIKTVYSIERDNSQNSCISTIHEYCSEWIKGDHKAMYSLLSSTKTNDMTFEEFKEIKEDEMRKIGAIKKCTITDKVNNTGNKALYSVKVILHNNMINQLNVKNWCEINKRKWLLTNGGLVDGITRTPFY